MTRLTLSESLSELWNGRLPLSRAFWQHAVIYGAIVNLVATGGALSTLVLGLPSALALAVHLLPVPYVVATVIGVYRSAERHAGSPVWARSAEIAVVAWAGLMFLL